MEILVYIFPYGPIDLDTFSNQILGAYHLRKNY